MAYSVLIVSPANKLLTRLLILVTCTFNSKLQHQFHYRVTQNLPERSKTLSEAESLKIFTGAVFYVGKGKKSRPYAHLKEAIRDKVLLVILFENAGVLSWCNKK